MEKRNQSYNIEDIMEKMDKNKLTFDYPIQREDGQWDRSQKALLIDTVFNGYIVPDIYIIKEGTEDFSPMSVLDGKQRLTTLHDFYKDGFALPKDADDVVIKDVSFDEDRNPIEEEKTYKVAGKKFSKLDEDLQKIFRKFKLDVKLLAGYTDEQIEEQFYRLNNGCTFTKSQKANVKLGTELAGKIKEIEECDFFENRAAFSNSQKKRGEITSCILQSMMLLSGHDFKNFGANEVLKFAKQLSENPDYELVDKCKDLYDRLFCVLPDYNAELDKQFKKIHIPTMIMNLDTSVKMGNKIKDYEYTEFLDDWFTAGMYCSSYMDYCGAGSTGKAKVIGRVEVMEEALNNFIDKFGECNLEGGDNFGNDKEDLQSISA